MGWLPCQCYQRMEWLSVAVIAGRHHIITGRSSLTVGASPMTTANQMKDSVRQRGGTWVDGVTPLNKKGGEKMEEERNIYQIGTVPVIGIYGLVATPSLIKIQTIKKKIVEQMPELPPKHLIDQGDTAIRILGRVGPYVVVHSDSQQFLKIHRNDFVDHIRGILIKQLPESDERPNYDAIMEEAKQTFYKLPQMFEG